MRPKAQIDGSRTDDGRKIDSWRFRLPDETRLEVDIRLHSHGGEMWFTTANKHPVFRHLSHRATDLAVLRTDVERDVHEVIEAHFGAQWAPAFLIEAERRNEDRDETPYSGANRDVILRLSVAPVRLDTTRPPSNRGVTRVIANEKPFDVIQRGQRDTFEVSGKSLNPENLRFSSERSKDISRVVLRESRGLEEDLTRLQDTVDRFAVMLADRMAPGEIAARGIPRPEDLADIMAAAADPDLTLEVPEYDGFRM